MEALLLVSAWILSSIFTAVLTGRFLSFSCGADDPEQIKAYQRLAVRCMPAGNNFLADTCGDRRRTPSVPW